MIYPADQLKQQAVDLGFNLVGLTRATPSPTLAAYERWIAQGMHADMGYMARPDRVDRRRNLQEILPGAQSLIVVGLDYRTLDVPDALLKNPSRGRFASYAWGMDYHDLIAPRLEQLANHLIANSHGAISQRVYVDTGAILERSHAQQAGLGFVGKNTMLIHPRRGSNFFLGEIITTLEFDTYDQPHRPTMCGTCTRCLVACPTDAFPQPHVLDARRCISYHTIENKGWIDAELRSQFGNWVFGCDICQDVCPFQRFSTPSLERTFYPDDLATVAPPLAELLSLDDGRFKTRYRGTPIYRIKRARLVRNACIAAGNSADPRLITHLRPLLHDENPLVRGHAAWALWRLHDDTAQTALTRQASDDPDAQVRSEAARLLTLQDTP